METTKDLYFSDIFDNIKKIDLKQTEKFSNELFDSYACVVIGEGRSGSAAYVGTEPLRGKITRITPTDIGFPGKNLVDGIPKLLEKYEKIFVMINSGGGETATPKMYAEQAESIMRDYDDFSVGVLTSYENSTIGKIGKKFEEEDRGAVILLKGRDKLASGNPKDSKKLGIMNDIYEQGSLMIIYEISDKGYLDLDKARIEYNEILNSVDDYLASEQFESLLRNLEKRSFVTVGCIGPSRYVALNLAIRLQHVKKSIGDDAFLSGAFAPAPRPGDILLFISDSGEPDPIKKWCEKFIEAGGLVYGITRKESEIYDLCNCYKLESPSKEDFYMRSTFVTSPIPVELADRTDSPENIMKKFHSATE
jgi:D-arabinose 5-phosphate isomerase GutQ